MILLNIAHDSFEYYSPDAKDRMILVMTEPPVIADITLLFATSSGSIKDQGENDP